MVLVFEEGKLSGLEEDDDRSSVLEVVVVEVSFLPSPSLLLVSFLACSCGGIDEVFVVVVASFLSLSLAFFVAVFSCTNRRCSS